MKNLRFTISTTIALLLAPSIAQAHLIGGSGFAQGLLHPFSGLDHLLAMVATGVISVRHGGKAAFIIPSLFLTSMIAGGVIGMTGTSTPPLLENAIALSVVVLGIAVAIHRKAPIAFIATIVGISGFLHGHAHGQEIPAMASAVYYALGFITATAALHVSGILIGRTAEKKTSSASVFFRNAGAATSAAGVLILFGVL